MKADSIFIHMVTGASTASITEYLNKHDNICSIDIELICNKAYKAVI